MHEFHYTVFKDPDVHVQDGWMQATETHSKHYTWSWNVTTCMAVKQPHTQKISLIQWPTVPAWEQRRRRNTLSARFNGNAMGMARGARFILGRGFLSWGPLGSLSSFPLHNRRAGSGQGSPTQTLTERARRPSRAPSPLDLAVCDSVRESGNVLFWYLPFSGAQFKVLFVGIFSPAPSSILPSDFSSTVFFRLVEIYSDSHCTVDLHYFAATWVTTILKVIRRKEEESDLVPGGMSITFFKSTLLILRVRLRVS